MANFKNFTKYTPTDKEDLFIMGVTFLKSEEGTDWYECQKEFSKDTLKVVYDPSTKQIISVSYDVSSLFPMGLSIGEVKTFPKRFDINGNFEGFVFNEEKEIISTRVYSLEEIKDQAEAKQKSLISDAMALISPLQFAKDLEMATEEEQARLKALQKYVVLLNRVPQQETYPTGIVWPEIPTT